MPAISSGVGGATALTLLVMLSGAAALVAVELPLRLVLTMLKVYGRATAGPASWTMNRLTFSIRQVSSGPLLA